MRCNQECCKKKLSITEEISNKCQCGKTYCAKHFQPEDHQCPEDYTKFKIKLEKVVAPKVIKI